MLPVFAVEQFLSLSLHFEGKLSSILAGKYYCYEGEDSVVGLFHWS